jgi:hypothetical protein
LNHERGVANEGQKIVPRLAAQKILPGLTAQFCGRFLGVFFPAIAGGNNLAATPRV